MTADPSARRRRRARRASLVAAPLACAALTAGLLLSVPALRRGHPPATSGAVPVSTAMVVRANLSNTTQVGGSLS
jgi:hypothetical protein